MLELAAVCIALVALLAYRERIAASDRREALREIAGERAVAAKERAELMQRIQAPDVAVDEHVRDSRPERRRRPRPIAADDDKAFAARRREAEAERGHVEDERG